MSCGTCAGIRRDLAQSIRRGALVDAAKAAATGAKHIIKTAAPAVTAAISGRR
jgi:hypothetical protein